MKRWCCPIIPSLTVLICLLSAVPFFYPATPARAATETPSAAIPAWATLDQADLAAFTSLSPDEQEARRQEALSVLEVALTQTSAPGRLEALRRAVARAPGEPLVWVHLGETLRWLGNDPAARAALDSGRSLFPGTEGEHRRECIRRYALNMGWLEYEAGQWGEAEAWGTKAREFDAGLDGLLVELLGMSGRSMAWDGFDTRMGIWKPFANNSNNRSSNARWCMRHFELLHRMPYQDQYFAGIQKLRSRTKPDPANMARWRDHGLICETNDKQKLAVQYYQAGAQAHPLAAGGWLQEHRYTHPQWGPEAETLPCWTGPEGFYVTGSLVAYAEHAMAMLADPQEAARQEFWVERLMEVASRTKHRYPNFPPRSYWRAVAYTALGKTKYALEELFTGRDLAQQLGQKQDPRIIPLEGHLHLLRKKYAKAKPLLEEAVQTFPRDAGCWADLGIILAAENRTDKARHAFDMALSLNENLAQVWHNRGILSSREQKWQASLDDLRRASDLAPGDEQIQQDLERIAKHWQYLQVSGKQE